MIVGDIQKTLDVPASTLSHHLAKLARAGLVSQGRRGREICCGVDYGEMQSLISVLTEECGAGVTLVLLRKTDVASQKNREFFYERSRAQR